MNSKIRVLVVDDSAIIRRVLSDVIATDPLMELAGVAANGQIALSMLERVTPDVVTLDIEMPVMDGLETLKAIRDQRPRLPVIMVSSLTERGAEATIESLSLGASDYVTKSVKVSNLAESKEAIAGSLLPKIRALCASRVAAASPAAPLSSARSFATRPLSHGRIDVVAIGSSTGGPNALAEVLPQLPADFPVPVVVVQHMPPMFTKFLAQRLDALSGLEVKEAASGVDVVPGIAWIAPGDYHAVAVRDGVHVRLATNQAPPENSCRPSVDVLFRSVCEAYGGNALAVVLTGMGQDGLRGCERLVDAGAQIIVQDEASSVVWGMPGFVAKAGLANAVLPVSQIATEIVRRVTASRCTIPRPSLSKMGATWA